MPEVNSRSETVDRLSRSRYITSEPSGDAWGQPPASHYRFHVVGARMFGMLITSAHVVTEPSTLEDSSKAELSNELAIWDSLSDEALLSFEDSLD